MKEFNNFKFRAWDDSKSRYTEQNDKLALLLDGSSVCYLDSDLSKRNDLLLEPYIGVNDLNGDNIFVGDVLKFDNGDTCIVKVEWFFEFYCEWIGEPECEDQVRDLYRLENAVIVGNVNEDSEYANVN